MPVIADRVYGYGAGGLGFMMGAAGFGALIGALLLAGRTSTAGLNRRVPVAGGLFGASLVGIGLTPPPPVTLTLLVLMGLCGMYQVAGSNTILQTLVEEGQRGRVMSYFSMAVLGMMPPGNLLAGAVAQRFGAPATLAAGGACCLLGAAILARGYLAIRLPQTMSGAPSPARPSDA
jgi:MFS family permease